jgi:phage replication-related protein YjqB (UPF0714/DUF867 family)
MTMVESTTSDIYPSNTALYSDPKLFETVDYARRYRRQELFDDGLPRNARSTRRRSSPPHGGGIEFGTSELCLAIADNHPATLAVTPGTGVTYDYWMFDGLRPSDNSKLHVTSTHCDDGVARSLCAEALNVLALHGCTTAQAGQPDDSEVALVGGLNATLKQRLREQLAAVGLQAIDAHGHDKLDGEEPTNITNRTLLGMGGQLEITGPMRSAMFTENTRPRRKFTTTKVFWDLAAACRNALARVEAEQVIL